MPELEVKVLVLKVYSAILLISRFIIWVGLPASQKLCGVRRFLYVFFQLFYSLQLNDLKVFLFASSLVMLLLFFDDRFRLTLTLCVFFGTCKVVKLSVYSLYGLGLISYAWFFRYTIRQTPYVPLLVSFVLFGFSSAIDITPISSRGIHAMLEDGTKLVGLINMTIYFWWICHQEIKKNLSLVDKS